VYSFYLKNGRGFAIFGIFMKRVCGMKKFSNHCSGGCVPYVVDGGAQHI
jgi:hypothetical protein